MTNLHHIGKKLRTINQAPGHPTGPLPGSLRGPVLPRDDKPRTVTITRAKAFTHDPRFQCAPGEEVPQLFGAYFPGIDPLTGKPWEKR